jgi:hypothetical protein
MVLTRATEIASVISGEVGSESPARGAFIDSAFERVLGRTPTDAERVECVAGLVRLAEALAPDEKTMTAAEARARTAFVHVLLNHNDFVTIR